jgi:hypothetical protein
MPGVTASAAAAAAVQAHLLLLLLYCCAWESKMPIVHVTLIPQPKGASATFLCNGSQAQSIPSQRRHMLAHIIPSQRRLMLVLAGRAWAHFHSHCP